MWDESPKIGMGINGKTFQSPLGAQQVDRAIASSAMSQGKFQPYPMDYRILSIQATPFFQANLRMMKATNTQLAGE
jgi:hypothetical protein